MDLKTILLLQLKDFNLTIDELIDSQEIRDHFSYTLPEYWTYKVSDMQRQKDMSELHSELAILLQEGSITARLRAYDSDEIEGIMEYQIERKGLKLLERQRDTLAQTRSELAILLQEGHLTRLCTNDSDKIEGIKGTKFT